MGVVWHCYTSAISFRGAQHGCTYCTGWQRFISAADRMEIQGRMAQYSYCQVRGIVIHWAILWQKNLLMLNLRKPALLFNIIGVILFFIGLFMQQKQNYGGETLMYIGLSMAVIYWFWAIVDVVKADDLK